MSISLEHINRVCNDGGNYVELIITRNGIGVSYSTPYCKRNSMTWTLTLNHWVQKHLNERFLKKEN